MKILSAGCLAVAVIYVFPSMAQHANWQPVGYAPDIYGWGDSYYSENLGLVFYPQGLWEYEVNQPISNHGFNGSEWVEVLNGAGAPNLMTAADYEQGILIGGSSVASDGTQSYSVAYYEDGSWSFPWEFNGPVRKLKWTNDTLFALGSFTSIDNQAIEHVAKLVNDQWQSVMDDSVSQIMSPGLLHDIEYFSGSYYVSGALGLQGAPTVYGFAKIENRWLVPPAQSPLLTAPIHIQRMHAFDGYLYLNSGAQSLPDQNVHGVMRFDGINFEPLGEGLKCITPDGEVLNAGIFNFVDDGEYLYASGLVSHYHAVPIGNILRWDGSKWCGIFGEEFLSLSTSLSLINGQIFLRTILNSAIHPLLEINFEWLYTGGDAVSNCTGPLSAGQEAPEDLLTLHPNPAHTHATLTSAQHPLERLALCDLQGRVVHEARPAAPTYRIPLTGLPAGMYVVSVQVGGEVVRKKLVVE